ncbi:histidine--tRNA ligase [Lysobacter sp. HX-5-24]|uniref:Histidine--tRNA ligase n=1 Tax=Noviluteimonas gilva TaxID=2682097 RepID=A0A7C9LN91_9GAMM|nr:histidine--tRNA ligase [Lysobacter gilvus]MUV14323.1 histidine--tRNA ligase [Lysobacter gilvus]
MRLAAGHGGLPGAGALEPLEPALSTPIKPRTPSGVMELLPRDQIAFQRMLDTIRRTFEQFGFLPVETPVMELSDVLLTKSGGDTERQVYFVQSTGALDNAAKDGRPELALRFDLTVPLARYVAEHEHDLAFPFRRYQMQRVYRGERAQSGRYREFYQCDIDVIGKDSLSPRFDAEIPAVIASVFEHLAIGDFTIHFNHRKLLRGYFEGLGIGDGEQQTAVLRELDKLDKRGPDAVRATLLGEGYGLSQDVVDALMSFSQVRSNGHVDALVKLDDFPQGTALFEEGRAELRAILAQLQALGVPEHRYALNLSIARGLDYYTGIVYETFLDAHPQIGSICSGGRYDNLASHYTKSKLPGVGISIGLTRLFYQLQKAGLVSTAASSVDVLVSLMDDALLPDALALSQRLRAAGMNVETQLEPRKLAKQLQYADRAGIRFVAIRGEDEISRGVVAVKDMRSGDQFELTEADLPAKLHQETVR